jgi:predicted RecA/RadA family phage recombinase
MKNYIQAGENITITAVATGTSGNGLLLGSLFGILMADVKVGEEVELKLVGVFELPKTEAQAWAVGAVIYWDDTNKVCTTTATSNTKIGHAVEIAANPSTVGVVRLSGASG